MALGREIKAVCCTASIVRVQYKDFLLLLFIIIIIIVYCYWIPDDVTVWWWLDGYTLGQSACTLGLISVNRNEISSVVDSERSSSSLLVLCLPKCEKCGSTCPVGSLYSFSTCYGTMMRFGTATNRLTIVSIAYVGKNSSKLDFIWRSQWNARVWKFLSTCK